MRVLCACGLGLPMDAMPVYGWMEIIHGFTCPVSLCPAYHISSRRAANPVEG